MIFVTGGAFQGKTSYVKEHFEQEYDHYTVVNHYHLRIREQMEAGADPLAEAKRLVRDRGEDLIVICDEIGNGLVPMDAFERAYREMTGRVACYLAGEAEQVIRVVCGIGSRIK